MSTQKQSFKHNLIEKFSSESAKIDPVFKSNLEKDLLKEFRGKSQSNFIFDLFSMNKTKYISAGLAALTFVVAAGGIVSYPYAKDYYVRKTVDVKDVLSKASKNREQINNANKKINSLSTAGAGNSEDAAMVDFMYREDGFTMYKSSTKYGPAEDKCLSIVPGYFYPTVQEFKEAETVSYSYWENGDENNPGLYYDKFYSKDENGNLLSYSLVNEDGTYMYAGGSYAVLEKGSGPFKTMMYDTAVTDGKEYIEMEGFDQVDPSTDSGTADLIIAPEPGAGGEDMPVPAPEPMPEPIDEDPSTEEMYWGENQQMLGVEEIDGREHYVISFEYMTNCDMSADTMYKLASSDSAISNTAVADWESEATDKIVSVIYVDKETSNISKEENYLGSLDDNNLIFSRSNSSESRDASYEDVKGNFQFDFNVEVKVIDNSKYYVTDVNDPLAIEPLKEFNYEVLIPDGEEWVASSIYNSAPFNEINKLTSSRDFFPNNAFGNSLYQSVVENSYLGQSLQLYFYKSTEGTDISTFMGSSDSIEVEIYDELSASELFSKSFKSAQTYLLSGDKVTAIENVTVNINGENLNAKGFVLESQEYSYGGGEGDYVEFSENPAEPTLPGDDNYVIQTRKSVTLMVDYKGSAYAIHYTSYTGGAESLPIFKTLNSTTQIGEIKTLFEKSLDMNGSGSSEGSAGGSAY